MRAPLRQDLFLEYVGLVECHQDFGNLRDQCRVLLADESLDTAQQRLLVLLRRSELSVVTVNKARTTRNADQRDSQHRFVVETSYDLDRD